MRLKTRLALWLLPPPVVAGAILLAFSRGAVTRSLAEELGQQAIARAAESLDGLAEGLRERDEQRLLPQLQALARSGAAYAAVLDPAGVVVAHTDVAQVGKTWSDPVTREALTREEPLFRQAGRGLWALPQGQEALLEVAVPAWSQEADFILSSGKGGKTRLGTLRLGLSLERTRATEGAIARRVFWLMLAAGAVGEALTVLLAGGFVAPLQRIAEATRKISLGEYGVTVPSESSDELGELARSFNRMSQDLKGILENILDVLVVLDVDGALRTVNPAAARLAGYAEGELLGRPAESLFSVEGAPPWGDGAQGRSWLERIRKEGAVRDLDMTLLAKDGGKVPVLFSGSLLRDREGRPAGFICAAQDLRERKRLEVQLNQSTKMSAVGQLSAGVAHDFNNLLTAITGYSEMLLESMPAEDPQRADVAEILGAGQRAAALTRQLLAFSRKQVLQPQVVELGNLVTDSVRLLRRVIGENIELVTIGGGGRARVNVDPGQIGQVILNLAVNARDAMPEGGRLTLETAAVDVAPGAAPAGDGPDPPPGPYVTLTVRDTGCGMDRATLERLFEPFFTTKAQGQGTGLGLATVHGIVHQSGGRIFVASEVGKGTSFHIYLPRVEAPVSEEAPPPAPAPSAGRECLLLVEDEEIVRRLARRVLAGAGYEVLEAAGPEEGLRIARERQGPIHFLLTDLVMPGMSGGELVRRVVALRPGIKVLCVSGYTEESLASPGPGGPASGKAPVAFLQKPLQPKALLRKVRELLDGASGG